MSGFNKSNSFKVGDIRQFYGENIPKGCIPFGDTYDKSNFQRLWEHLKNDPNYFQYEPYISFTLPECKTVESYGNNHTWLVKSTNFTNPEPYTEYSQYHSNDGTIIPHLTNNDDFALSKTFFKDTPKKAGKWYLAMSYNRNFLLPQGSWLRIGFTHKQNQAESFFIENGRQGSTTDAQEVIVSTGNLSVTQQLLQNFVDESTADKTGYIILYVDFDNRKIGSYARRNAVGGGYDESYFNETSLSDLLDINDDFLLERKSYFPFFGLNISAEEDFLGGNVNDMGLGFSVINGDINTLFGLPVPSGYQNWADELPSHTYTMCMKY